MNSADHGLPVARKKLDNYVIEALQRSLTELRKESAELAEVYAECQTEAALWLRLKKPEEHQKACKRLDQITERRKFLGDTIHKQAEELKMLELAKRVI